MSTPYFHAWRICRATDNFERKHQSTGVNTQESIPVDETIDELTYFLNRNFLSESKQSEHDPCARAAVLARLTT